MGTTKSKSKVADAETSDYPKGWTVTDIGAEGYLVTHDGVNDDGTTTAGCSYKVHDLDDVAAVIAGRGKTGD